MLALPIFTASRPATIVGVRVLNFCVRDGREPERCLRQRKRGRSVCSGRLGSSLLCQATIPPGTANGNRWTVQLFPHNNKKRPHISVEALCLRYLFRG